MTYDELAGSVKLSEGFRDHVYIDTESQIAKLGNYANITYKEWYEKNKKKHLGNKFWCERFYLSPSAFAGKKYAQEDDIWALGVLIIEIATLHEKPQFYDPLTINFDEP